MMLATQRVRFRQNKASLGEYNFTSLFTYSRFEWLYLEMGSVSAITQFLVAISRFIPTSKEACSSLRRMVGVADMSYGWRDMYK